VARLKRSAPERAGILRKARGRGFTYVDVDGSTVKDPATRARIKDLVIPPAWRDVWICPYPNGHIQVTGVDAAGRRQYLYHADWRTRQDAIKHDHVVDVAERLPIARERIGEDLASRAQPPAGARDGGPHARPRLLPDRGRAVRRGEQLVRARHDPP